MLLRQTGSGKTFTMTGAGSGSEEVAERQSGPDVRAGIPRKEHEPPDLYH